LQQVIRMVSEGLAAFVLERSDSSKTMVRSVARELLASCVLRNLTFYFTPYTLNKVLRNLACKKTFALPV
jgi:PXA domain